MMELAEQLVDAVDVREADELRGQIEDLERAAALTRGTAPRQQHGQRGRIEMREMRAVDFARTVRDTLEPRRERVARAREGQRLAGIEARHEACPDASCALRCVRNWIRPSTPLCWIFSLNCCW